MDPLPPLPRAPYPCPHVPLELLVQGRLGHSLECRPHVPAGHWEGPFNGLIRGPTDDQDATHTRGSDGVHLGNLGWRAGGWVAENDCGYADLETKLLTSVKKAASPSSSPGPTLRLETTAALEASAVDRAVMPSPDPRPPKKSMLLSAI